MSDAIPVLDPPISEEHYLDRSLGGNLLAKGSKA